MDAAQQVRGRLRVLGNGGQGDTEFEDTAQAAEVLNARREAQVIVGGAAADRSNVKALRAALPSDSADVWHAADLSYLLDLPAATSLDELEELAQACQKKLARIDDDLLAQLCLLVQEQAAEGRLVFWLDEIRAFFRSSAVQNCKWPPALGA